MFTHEKSLAKGPCDKAETKTFKSYTFLLCNPVKIIPVSSLAGSMVRHVNGGTVQSVTS